MSDDVAAIETSGLTKSFDGVRAVDGADLSVPPGTVYGLLGPNGAGKTTLIRLLATLLVPDAGTARVFGHDVVREAQAVRSRISVTGQHAAIDDALTGAENLVVLARLLGYTRSRAHVRVARLLGAMGLADAGGRLVRTYSGGMRRRLDIAASLLVAPELLFLDEPTTGLDPRSRNEVWQIVRSLVVSGTTVLLTTQYLDEADRLTDRIAVIDHGRVVSEGTSHMLKATVGGGTLDVRLRHAERRDDALRILSRQLGVPVERGADPLGMSARVGDTDPVAPALAALTAAGVEVSGFALGQPSLDDVFLALTGSNASPHPTATRQEAS
jgi:ABC-2 type transport system ATP-binding protein